MGLQRIIRLVFAGASLVQVPLLLAQCGNNNTLVGATLTVPCPGSAAGACIQGGQFQQVNVTVGNVYSFSTCSAPYDTHITLYVGLSALNVGFNNDGCNGTGSTVQWTATFTGVLRVLLDRGAACNTSGSCANLWVTCGLNDDPCSSTLLPVNTSCTNTVGTNVGATPSTTAAPSCAAYGGSDVWYRFVAPASGLVTLTGSLVGGSSLTDGGMAVYTAAACGAAMTELACNDDSNGLMPVINLTGLTSGTTYYVRFWEYGNDAFGAFNICATTPPPPANNDPCGAPALTVGSSCTNTLSTTIGATSTTGIPAPTCGNYLGGDVWFRVVAPASGRLAISTSTVGGSSLTNGAMALYTAATCSASMTQVACNDNSPADNMPALSLTGLIGGTTYYLRFWANGNTTSGQFNICALEPIVNDEPCAAIALTVGSTCAMVSRTNVGGTISAGVPLPGCGTLTGTSSDVWFRFVAPASGIAIIESTAGGLTDGSMALYLGSSCTGSSLSLIQCSADEGLGAMPFLRFADLVPGATYYLRYWGSGTASGTFNLCVWSPTIPPGSCAYFLELFDSGENGWGTSAVQVQINGGPILNYTVAAADFYNNVVFAVNPGNVLVVSYVNTGANQAQNRYAIRQMPGGFGVFQAGPSPANGPALVEVIDCTPPPPPREDCSGGLGVCGAQTLNDNPAGTGFAVDLRATTFGCLATSERQGTWYRFSPSASGTIGLTIAPADALDDYDFAIWGPETTVICPPTRQPTRCSYSGLTGTTGLRTTSTDTTEGSGGDKWVAALNATAGQRYVMYISNFSQSGLAFSLTWQLSNGAALDCVLLPVDFMDLDAVLAGTTVEVNWSTASESNASHYIVERSDNAVDYTPIGSLQAMGNTSTLTNYGFVDEAPMEGLNYYRVQQVDMDGALTISPADYAIYRKAATQMVVFPNPAGDMLFANFDMPEDDAVIWRIIDAQGRLLEQDLYQGTKGNMLIDVPLERLAAGNYTLLVNDVRGRMNYSAHFVKH